MLVLSRSQRVVRAERFVTIILTARVSDRRLRNFVGAFDVSAGAGPKLGVCLSLSLPVLPVPFCRPPFRPSHSPFAAATSPPLAVTHFRCRLYVAVLHSCPAAT